MLFNIQFNSALVNEVCVHDMLRTCFVHKDYEGNTMLICCSDSHCVWSHKSHVALTLPAMVRRSSQCQLWFTTYLSCWNKERSNGMESDMMASLVLFQIRIQFLAIHRGYISENHHSGKTAIGKTMALWEIEG